MRKATMPVSRAFSLLLAFSCTCQSAPAADPPLNLSSSQKTVNAGQLPGFVPARINVGGAGRVVNAQTMLTPAEAAALMQVISTGRQSLTIGSYGTAIGGWVNLTSALTNTFGSVVIPHSVKAVGAYSAANNLTINGDLTNSGIIYAVSTNASIVSATLAANNINNLAKATITSILPTTGLPGVTSAVANLDLTLAALGNITNKGTISSSGALSLTAGGTITASGGTMSAQNNIINFSTNAGDVVLNGGNYSAQAVNFNAATGSVTAQVNRLEGTVNVNACNARVIANTSLLQIGNIITTGDPIFANTGSIAIQGIQTNGAPLVVVSGQDITFGSGGIGTKLDTSSTSGSGGNVYLIAGAKFTPAPYTSGPITILGASPTGGKVDLTANGFTGIDTSASPASGGAGNVEISAFAGKGSGAGQILMPNASSITAVGSSTGGPGHIFLVAGASTNSAATPSISVGDIDTTGGPAPGTSGLAGGHLVFTTEQPNVSSTNPLVMDPSNGSILRGGILGGAMANSPISTGNITTGGGQVIIFSGMGITSGTISTIGATNTTPSGSLALIANGSGKNPAQSDISVGSITTKSNPGGTGFAGRVLIMTSSDISLGDIDTSGTVGGSILLLAGSTTGSGNITAGNLTTSSSSLGAGEVVILSATACTSCPTSGVVQLNNINTSSIGGGSNSGAVTISTPGSIDFGTIDTRSNSTGRSVFLSSAGAITGTGIDTSTTSALTTDQAGGIYVLTKTAINISGGGTQNQPVGAPAPNLIAQAYTPSITSIAGNAGTQTVTLGTANTAPSAFAPGGYTSINDQTGTGKGNALLQVSVSNDNTVIVPIVSLGSFSLLGSTAAPSGIESTGANGTKFALFGGNGMNIGGPNAFITSIGTPSIDLKVVAATTGSVTVNNGGSFAQPAGVYAAASANGALSITNRNGMSVIDAISAATPAKGSAITLDVPGAAALSLFGNISAAGALTMQPSGLGDVAETAPGVIGAPALSIGNSAWAGTAGNPSAHLFADVNQLTVRGNLAQSSGGAVIDALSNMTVSFAIGGVMVLNGNNHIILLPSSAGSAAALTIGSLQALSSSTVLSSPKIILSATRDIGSAALPLNISNVKGNSAAPQAAVQDPAGSVFLTSKGDVSVVGASNVGNLSVVSGGSILLTTATITGSNLTLRTGANGGLVTIGIGSQLNSASIDLAAGKLGVGFAGTPGNQIQLANGTSTTVHVVSTGSVRLFANNSILFSGASSVGHDFALLGQNVDLTFADGASIKSQTIALGTGSTAGSITQLGTNTTLNSSSTILQSHDEIQLRITGGILAVNSTNDLVSIDAGSSVKLELANGAAGSFQLTSGKDVILNNSKIVAGLGIDLQAGGSITFVGDGTISALQSNNPILLTATSGNIGSTATPIPVDTGLNGLPALITVSAPNGSAFINGLSNVSAVGLSIDASNVKGTLSINSAAPVTVGATPNIAGIVKINSLGTITGNGTTDFQTQTISLQSKGTVGAIRIAAPAGSTKPINVTAVETGDFGLISSSSMNLMGASSGTNDFSLTATTGDINMAAKSSITIPIGADELTLSAPSGNITQSAKGVTLMAPTLNMDANNIGTSKVSVGVSSLSAGPVILKVAPAQNAFISANSGVSMQNSFIASGTFQLTTSGSDGVSALQVAQSFNAPQVILSTLNNADIAITNGSVINSSGTVTLNANGRGNIVTTSGGIIAKDLSLTTGSGSIGFLSLPIQGAVSNTMPLSNHIETW